MLSSGADVDIESGSPIPVMRKKREEKRVDRVVSDYQELSNDLSGDGGEVLKRVAGLYINRINEVVKADPACVAFQSVFDDLNIKINVGKKFVDIKVRNIKDKTEKQSL